MMRTLVFYSGNHEHGLRQALIVSDLGLSRICMLPGRFAGLTATVEAPRGPCNSGQVHEGQTLQILKPKAEAPRVLEPIHEALEKSLELQTRNSQQCGIT